LQVNTSLVSTTAKVHWQVFHDLQARQFTQTDLTNFRSYLDQTSQHLQGIQLNEPIRTQVYNLPEYLQPPNQQVLQAIYNTSDPSLIPINTRISRCFQLFGNHSGVRDSYEIFGMLRGLAKVGSWAMLGLRLCLLSLPFSSVSHLKGSHRFPRMKS
jgi:hypothetical protein